MPTKIRIPARRDFLDPDFGVKASLRFDGSRHGCGLDVDADSEIPSLGLDSGRLNINCGVDPARVIDTAARLAHTYKKLRGKRPNRPKKLVDSSHRYELKIKKERTYAEDQ